MRFFVCLCLLFSAFVRLFCSVPAPALPCCFLCLGREPSYPVVCAPDEVICVHVCHSVLVQLFCSVTVLLRPRFPCCFLFLGREPSYHVQCSAPQMRFFVCMSAIQCPCSIVLFRPRSAMSPPPSPVLLSISRP